MARDNYVTKKTWNEAMKGEEASGDYDTFTGKTDHTFEAAHNNGGGTEPVSTDNQPEDTRTLAELRREAEGRDPPIDHAGLSKKDLLKALEG